MEATTTHPKRAALGKGIESLLGPRQPAPAATAPPAEPTGRPLEIPVDRIERNPHQTRTTFDEEKLAELAQSISANGVLVPITVRAIADGRYQLIMGERRWRASQMAGKTTIPAVVEKVSEQKALEMTIVENLQREDLNPMEQARAFDRLAREFKMTQEQVATRTGKNRASVTNFLRLLKLPVTLQASVESGNLSFGHAKALLSLESEERMVAAGLKVLAADLSVRQTETYVQGLLNPERKLQREAAAAPAQDPNVREAQDMLQRKLGLKVHIEDKHGKGRVVIEYSGVDDFDAILAALGE